MSPPFPLRVRETKSNVGSTSCGTHKSEKHESPHRALRGPWGHGISGVHAPIVPRTKHRVNSLFSYNMIFVL